MQPLIERLPRDLCGEEPHRYIGKLVLGVEPWPGWHQAGNMPAKIADAVALKRTDHECRFKWKGGIELGRHRKKRFPFHGIDLVEHENGGNSSAGKFSDDGSGVLIEPLACIYNE